MGGCGSSAGTMGGEVDHELSTGLRAEAGVALLAEFIANAVQAPQQLITAFCVRHGLRSGLTGGCAVAEEARWLAAEGDNDSFLRTSCCNVEQRAFLLLEEFARDLVGALIELKAIGHL